MKVTSIKTIATDERMFREAWVEGMVVVGAAHEVLCTHGCGADSRFRTLATDSRWLDEARDRRICILRLKNADLPSKTDDYVIVVTPLDGATLLLIGRSPSDAILTFLLGVGFAWDILEHFLTDPFEALVIVDEKAKVRYISRVHETFLGLQPGGGVGKPVRDVVENSRLGDVVRSGKAQIGSLQKLRGLDRIVSRIPVKRDGKVIGAYGRVMFKGPGELEEMSERIRNLESEVQFYKRHTAVLGSRNYGLDAIIGESAAIKRLKADILKVAPLEIAVLITGESGTGKELVAQAIHLLSPRRDGAMVTLNAAALPATLVEAELFGYEPGAFTGAHKSGRKGKFEQANNGSILLDEIGDMPIEIQAKLLRVLQDRIVQRVGGEQSHKSDFRLISATNRNLQNDIENALFRLDLFYRISPVVLEIPPLRDRLEDIPALVDKFLHELAFRHAVSVPEISEGAISYLMDCAWPGNVRQLQHEVESAFVFSDRRLIVAEDFRYMVSNMRKGAQIEHKPATDAKDLRAMIGSLEDEQIKSALQKFNGNKVKVAAQLGISRSYLYKKLAELAL